MATITENMTRRTITLDSGDDFTYMVHSDASGYAVDLYDLWWCDFFAQVRPEDMRKARAWARSTPVRGTHYVPTIRDFYGV